MREFIYSNRGLTIDFTNMMAGHNNSHYAIKTSEFAEFAEKSSTISLKIKENRESHRYGFMELPYNDSLIDDIERIVESKRSFMDNLLLLGIGGSALGNITTHNALNDPFHNLKFDQKNYPRIFIEDNIDPDRIHALFDYLDWERTVVNVITKSGTTPETMASYFVAMKYLKERVGDDYSKHVVAITDPEKGLLRKIAEQKGFDTLPIPPNVGGRFSVLSSVGLFSAAATGIDIGEILRGAKDMDIECRNEDLYRNPALLCAALKYIPYKRGIRINVLMPYSSALKNFSSWYCQLIGESLGKKYDLSGNVCHEGITPVQALGATDQHSQIQLYNEGPEDKIIIFIFVEKHDNEVVIPDESIPEELSYLKGITINELLKAEGRSTAISLKENGRLNFEIGIQRLTPYSLGQLFYLFEMVTSILGMLLNINPFDQPGVDRGKVLTKEFLTKKG